MAKEIIKATIELFNKFKKSLPNTRRGNDGRKVLAKASLQFSKKEEMTKKEIIISIGTVIKQIDPDGIKPILGTLTNEDLLEKFTDEKGLRDTLQQLQSKNPQPT